MVWSNEDSGNRWPLHYLLGSVAFRVALVDDRLAVQRVGDNLRFLIGSHLKMLGEITTNSSLSRQPHEDDQLQGTYPIVGFVNRSGRRSLANPLRRCITNQPTFEARGRIDCQHGAICGC
jgi:hypothetical protein